MKKLFLGLALIFLTCLSFTIPKVEAVDIDPITLVYEYQGDWYAYNTYSNYWLLRVDIPVNAFTKYIYIDIPADSEFTMYSSAQDDFAKIIFFQDTNVYYTYKFNDLATFSDITTTSDKSYIQMTDIADGARIKIDFDKWENPIVTPDGGYDSIQISIPIVTDSYGTVAVTNMLLKMDALSIVRVQHQSVTVKFIDKLSLIYSETVVNTLPTFPVDPVHSNTDLTFRGWILPGNGYTDEYLTDLKPYMVVDGELKLLSIYADLVNPNDQYTPIVQPDNTAPDDINALFAAFGFDSTGGYMIVYVFLVIVILIGLSALKAPMIVHFIAISAVSILFAAVGLLPVYIVIILFMLLALVLIALNRGVVSE